MSISFKSNHLKRYKDLALLILKYGNKDLVHNFGLRAALEETDYTLGTKNSGPEDLARDLEKMGPTFIKLGQLLSSRADLLPAPYLKALSRLQDNVAPFPASEVEEIVASELGVRMSKAFREFELQPIAAASLGQVHRAVLREGQKVVVKVQRPGIRAQIADDLEVLEQIVHFLEQHTEFGNQFQVTKLFEEFQRTLINELDYQKEAANLVAIGNNLKDFAAILVPQPIPDYTTRNVLTMERVEGKKVTSIQPLERLDIDGSRLATELFKAYLKQVLVDGIFHADPHPGNVFLTDDGRIALLDLGMIGRTPPDLQEEIVKILLAVSEGRSLEAAEVTIKISQTTANFDAEEFRRKIGLLVAENQETTLEHIDVGLAVLELGRIAGHAGLFVPTTLSMLGKALLQLDQIGRILDPKFNPNEAVRRHVKEIFNLRLGKDISAGKLLSSFLEIKDFIGGLPVRVNRLLDTIGTSNFEVKVRSTDVHLFLEGFQKIANRITTGLILASLIIGAALLMHVKTPFEIFGYPGLAIVCFVFAAGGGFWLVLSIFVSDQKAKRRQKSKRI